MRLTVVDGDALAARTVLQAMLRGAASLIKRQLHRGGLDVVCVEVEVVATLTMMIHSYPYRRRPQRIAANLLADTHGALYRASRPGREIPVSDGPVGADAGTRAGGPDDIAAVQAERGDRACGAEGSSAAVVRSARRAKSSIVV